jgi:hypothetical protein
MQNSIETIRVNDLWAAEIPLEPPCQSCGCGTVFAAVAPAGQRDNPVFLRCCQCGRERDDLQDFPVVRHGTAAAGQGERADLKPAPDAPPFAQFLPTRRN